jgi:SPP1 gp7 family putative phage head morphogenesis protein
MKKKQNYWTNRAKEREAQSMELSEASLRRIKLVYGEIDAEMHKEVTSLIAKYANENGFTMTEAKTRLTKTEKDDLSVSIKKYAELHEMDNYIVDEMLDRISTRVRITRIEGLSMKFDIIGQNAFELQNELLPKMMSKVYYQQYHKKIFDVQSRGGMGKSFTHISKVKQNVLTEYIGQTQSNQFSQSLWKNTNKMVAEWGKILEVGIVQGKGSSELTKELSERTGVSYNRTKTLVKTETNYIHNQATLDGYKQMDVQKYKFLSTLDGRTTTVCQHLDLKEFNISEVETGVNYPPMHYNCRSTTLEVFPDWLKEIQGETKRTARDNDGNNYIVDGKMNYEEWYKKYVK